jgi:GTPase
MRLAGVLARALSGAPPRPRGRRRAAPQHETGLVLAAVGRANVGKSTLFNRLARAADAPFVPSVVDSFPGVTRDPRRAAAAVGDLGFTLVDTAGLEEAPAVGSAAVVGAVRRGADIEASVEPGIVGRGARESLLTVGALDPDEVYRALYRGMAGATERAVRDADAAVFVLDAASGVTAVDAAIARWLRTLLRAEDVLVVANKCDMIGARDGYVEALALGFGEPLAISAEHNTGFDEVYAAVLRLHEKRQARLFLPATAATAEKAEALAAAGADVVVEEIGGMNDGGKKGKRGGEVRADIDDVDHDDGNDFGEDDGELLFDPDFVRDPPLGKLVVSIVGRPNVGKSSLLTRLIGRRDAALVGPASGVTRDAVLAEWVPPSASAEPLWLVDTAGIRARHSVRTTRVEELSVKASLRALRQAHVAVLVVDANHGLTDQDVKIAHVVITEGRAIVLVVNKMDCMTGSTQVQELREAIAQRTRTALHQIAGVEVVEMSAHDWDRTGMTQAAKLYGAIQRARVRWERRVGTSALTRYVTRFNETIAIGMSGAKRGRRGVTKFISQRKVRPPMFRLDGSSAVSDNYIQALTNGIRSEFGFEGVPIRIKRPSRRQRR